jgi:hypothetical protein
VESSCELGNEPSGSIKCWESTEWLHNLWPLERYSAPQSYSWERRDACAAVARTAQCWVLAAADCGQVAAKQRNMHQVTVKEGLCLFEGSIKKSIKVAVCMCMLVCVCVCVSSGSRVPMYTLLLHTDTHEGVVIAHRCAHTTGSSVVPRVYPTSHKARANKVGRGEALRQSHAPSALSNIRCLCGGAVD